jgi:hypothetical protein
MVQVLDPEVETSVAKRSANVEIAMTRAAQEVQAAMIVAKKFRRNEREALEKIKEACKSVRLAEDSQYEYARGGTEIVGPSIRLLEAISQRWGNCEGGVIELDRSDGKSVAMSYAVDLESNHREVRIFEVEHVRDTRKGSFRVTDNRDIYELVANQGSRRRRACYQAVIPADIVDEAIEACNQTLRGESKDPLSVRITKMVEAFAQFNVSPDMIARKAGCSLDAISYIKLSKLRRIFNSIKDGMGDVADFFEVSTPQQPTGKSSFGFKKAEEPKTEANHPPASSEPPTGQPAQPGAGTPDVAALEAEARAREQQEAAAEHPGAEQPTREQLLEEITALQDARKMKAADRSGLWKQHCGTQTQEKVDLATLTKLRDHLRIMAGVAGGSH